MGNYLKIFVASLIILGELTALMMGYHLMGMSDTFLNYIGATIVIGASLIAYYGFYAMFVRPMPK